MQTVVTVIRNTDPVWDDATGTNVPTTETVYAGRARIRFTDTQPRESDAAGERVVDQAPRIYFPVAGTGSIRVDDLVTVTSNALDTALVGTVFRISGAHAQTHSTARRFPVEVVTRG